MIVHAHTRLLAYSLWQQGLWAEEAAHFALTAWRVGETCAAEWSGSLSANSPWWYDQPDSRWCCVSKKYTLAERHDRVWRIQSME